MVFGATWLATGLLTVAQMVKQGIFKEHKGEEWAALLTVLIVSLTVGVTFGLLLAGRHAHVVNTSVQSIEQAIELANYVANQVAAYYGFLAVILILGGLALLGERIIPKEWTTAAGPLLGIVLLVSAIVASYNFNLRPIKADIVFKQADPWERQGQWFVAIQHYQAAIELFPWENEDFYYLYQGRALLEYASSLEDVAEQDLVLRETERVLLQAQTINPLNTDHSANLARMYRRWADLPAGREQRQVLSEISAEYYDSATTLSPNNAILWNEWAMVYHYNLGDEETFQERIDHSLELDDEFAQTWLLLGDVRAGSGDLEGAAEAYERALELNPRQRQVWNALGRTYLQLNEFEEAIDSFLQAIEVSPEASDVWDTHRLLAIAYYQSDQPELALQEAQIALELAPEDQRPNMEQLVQQLTPVPTEVITP
jgi:tetratricopeptide (TPR) repeat protein